MVHFNGDKFLGTYENKFTGYLNYKKVETLDLCKSTPVSFFTDNTNLWINTIDGLIPVKSVKLVMGMTINTFTPNVNIPYYYIEGMDIYINSTRGSLCIRSSLDNQFDTIAYVKNIRTFNNRLGNGISFESIKLAINQNCYGYACLRDALNYHTSYLGFEKIKFIEINGSSFDTGKDALTEYSSNGSTAHDGAIGIRFGGDFNTARGGVVIDVNPNTYTLNFSIQSKNSMLENTAAFQAQNGATMRLYNCYAKSNIAIKAETNARLFYDTECIIQGRLDGDIIKI